jgi:hypothetical protein
MTSSMENRPEPMTLYAQDVGGGFVRVMDGEAIVAQTNSAEYVAATIRELKLRGVDHETSVIIQGVSGNPAYNGALGHYAS